MRSSIILLGLALLAGCSSSSDETRPVYPERLRADTGVVDPLPLSSAGDPAIEAVAARWADQLTEADRSGREQAAAALGDLKAQGLPHLLAGMRHADWEVRLASLQAVHKPVLEEHADEALPLLTELLGDPSPLVRQQAAYRLSWLGDHARSALTQLERLAAQDPSPDVRGTAADVVVEMNESLTNLQRLLQHYNPLVRARAAGTLAGMERYAQGALPQLDFLAGNDPDFEVRQAAGQAAQAIRRSLIQ
jgi:HEAT repeat protein